MAMIMIVFDVYETEEVAGFISIELSHNDWRIQVSF
jgi:hypothetical protein